MNTKQIEYAVELSHTLNFRRAAENLFISQPALTYQIQMLEEEIGFEIFIRTGKGVVLTPAGDQFCKTLVKIQNELKNAIQDGRQFNSKYKETLTIALPLRSALYYLPQIMRDFAKEYPSVSIQIHYIYGDERIDSLLRGELDLVFGLSHSLNHYSNLKLHHLFDSHIYLITTHDDQLSKKDMITVDDLKGRTLMLGLGSPYELRKAQQYVIDNTQVYTLKTRDHLSVLTNVAAKLGVCLSPGFCNDHLNEFKWTPFDTTETIECVFASNKDDHRQILLRFIEITQNYYKNTKIPL